MPKPHPKPLSKEKVQITFGAALRKLREDQGLTQQQVAELADLHTNYVSSVERGERNLSLHNITKLAWALKTRTSSLTACLDVH